MVVYLFRGSQAYKSTIYWLRLWDQTSGDRSKTATELDPVPFQQSHTEYTVIANVRSIALFANEVMQVGPTSRRAAHCGPAGADNYWRVPNALGAPLHPTPKSGAQHRATRSAMQIGTPPSARQRATMRCRDVKVSECSHSRRQRTHFGGSARYSRIRLLFLK